jgi:hypothetical protein
LKALQDSAYAAEYLKEAKACGQEALHLAQQDVLESLPIHRLATITMRGTMDMEEERKVLETRLRGGLDKRCLVVVKGKSLVVGICGHFTEEEREHEARGVMRIIEWEAA